MNLRDAVFNHLSGITGLSAENVFEDTRKKEDADLENVKTRAVQCIFFALPSRGSGRVHNKEQRFEFHFLGDQSRKDEIETVRENFKKSIRFFSGKFGGSGGVIIRGAVYENENETIDFETQEKNFICRVKFNFIED